MSENLCIGLKHAVLKITVYSTVLHLSMESISLVQMLDCLVQIGTMLLSTLQGLCLLHKLWTLWVGVVCVILVLSVKVQTVAFLQDHYL